MATKTDHIVPDFLLSPQKRVYRHLLLQLIVFFITINVFWDTPDELIITPPRIRSWIGYFLMIDMLIYVNAYVLVPRFLLKGRFLRYLLSSTTLVLLCIIILGTLQTLFEDTRFESIPPSPSVMWLNIISSTVSCGLLVAASSALVLFKHWISNNQRIDELEAATLQSEVLFKLKDLLRYQLNDSSQEKIQLNSDIHFMNDFLNLEKIRRDNFNYIISKEGDINKVWLPPLLFIPFVENAVKHNTDSENASFVHLSFIVQDNRLLFRCENSIPLPEEEVKEPRIGGLGLKNIKRRLELLYPGRHSLEIIEMKQSYTVNLQLEL